MRLHRRITVLVAWSVSLLPLGLVANATATPSDSTDPRDKMNIWEGRWKEVVERKETPYGHADTIPLHVTCSWSADRGFMVCEYLSEKVAAGQSGPADHLTIFTYDDQSKAYKHLGISKDYKTLEEPNVIIEGNRWHYTYQVPDGKGGNFDKRDSYEFATPEKRITRIEISSDGGQHWTLLSESVGVKVH
jgi:hypothetical protein